MTSLLISCLSCRFLLFVAAASCVSCVLLFISGCSQHDSQEFLAFLLDGLHEDCNRARLPVKSHSSSTSSLPVSLSSSGASVSSSASVCLSQSTCCPPTVISTSVTCSTSSSASALALSPSSIIPETAMVVYTTPSRLIPSSTTTAFTTAATTTETATSNSSAQSIISSPISPRAPVVFPCLSFSGKTSSVAVSQPFPPSSPAPGSTNSFVTPPLSLTHSSSTSSSLDSASISPSVSPSSAASPSSDSSDPVVAWDNYLRRNRSAISRLFHGQLRSTVQCPVCHTSSVTFDPFSVLSLPIPVLATEVHWLSEDPTHRATSFGVKGMNRTVREVMDQLLLLVNKYKRELFLQQEQQQQSQEKRQAVPPKEKEDQMQIHGDLPSLSVSTASSTISPSSLRYSMRGVPHRAPFPVLRQIGSSLTAHSFSSSSSASSSSSSFSSSATVAAASTTSAMDETISGSTGAHPLPDPPFLCAWKSVNNTLYQVVSPNAPFASRPRLPLSSRFYSCLFVLFDSFHFVHPSPSFLLFYFLVIL